MTAAGSPYRNWWPMVDFAASEPAIRHQLRSRGKRDVGDRGAAGLNDSTAVEIRAMMYADVEPVAAIEADLHPIDAWSPEAFADAVSDPRTYLCRVAVDATVGLLGYAVVSVAADQSDLQNLTVHAEHQRRGTGRRLLVDALELARQRGAQEAFLEVRHDNAAAVALYDAYGFEVVGQRRDYYARGVDAVVMRTRLGPER